jgi:hypothetical protein
MSVKKFVIDWFIPIIMILFAIYMNQSQPQPLGGIMAVIMGIFFVVYLILKSPFH